MPKFINSPKRVVERLKSTVRTVQDQHRERHKPTGFGFAFADRVDYLDRSHWDAVTAGQTIFLDRRILRVIEQNGPDNIQPRYALVFDQATGNPVAALAVQIVSIKGDQLRNTDENKPAAARGNNPAKELLRRALRPSKKLVASGISERMLVTGNLLSWGFHGVAFAPDWDPNTVWPGIAEALSKIRRAERLTGQANFVMLKDCAPEQPSIETMRRFSYHPMETEPNMVLQVHPDWRSYDDYLAALDAKYRRNSKDQIKKLTAAGYTIERLAGGLRDNAKRLHELYLSVHSNAAVRLVTLPDTYLPTLAETAGEDFRCTVIRKGEDLIGFVTTLRDGDTAIAYYIGFDRKAAASGLPIYLRLLHSTIADAIDWRCKRLSLGRTALEPKAALGAKPEPVNVWLRHRVPVLNWPLRAVLDAVPHAEAPERNPFKTAAK